LWSATEECLFTSAFAPELSQYGFNNDSKLIWLDTVNLKTLKVISGVTADESNLYAAGSQLNGEGLVIFQYSYNLGASDLKAPKEHQSLEVTAPEVEYSPKIHGRMI